MKSKFVFSALALCMTASSLTAHATKEHDNDVYLHTNGLTGCSFTETGHSITSGQPYSGTTASGSDGKCTITVKAGRKKSSSVADWFTQQIGTGNAIACDSSGPMPDELNFAVEGTLTLTQGDTVMTCENMIVAQGNFSSVNNWWLGGSDVKSGGVPFIGPIVGVCSSGGIVPTAVTYTPQQPCVNNFNAVVE